MQGVTRFAMQRLAALDRAIRAGEYPNASSFAERMEVDARTIQRDLEFMRYRFGAPLVYDARRNGYRYDDPEYRLSFLELGEDELIALFLAEGVFRQYRDTPYAADLARACRKIAAGLTAESAHGLADSHSFRVSASAAVDGAILRILASSIRDRDRLAIRYYTASRDEEGDRLVDPYHLANIDGDFYLIAYCHRRGAVRTFNVSRIRTASPAGATFPPPDGFDVDGYLESCFAVLRGADGECHTVHLRFTGESIRYIRERTWHPSQRVVDSSDDALVLEWEVSHLREVERFALGWGADCEVLAPVELRDRMGRILHAAMDRYLPPEKPSAIQVD